ncbi:Meiotic coiled-coil protein 2 [Erysiphe necator]|uniref:Putative pumilio-family rna binding repeat protein n=1 Tax=Uncinula necator TaxID=52586 RepID=A0A0B1P8T5_UNCNE|nr:Meiotic coiled-coil protein 2 [Erysiphe necator]KHJ33740.1 putative pumilio-family rna binding repeat protein [Erysiphe necator]
MSGNVFTGSPQSRRATDGRSISQENSGLNGDELVSSLEQNDALLKKSVTTLSSSKLGNQAAPKKLKLKHDISSGSSESDPMEKLLAKLSQQQAAINQQHEALRSSDDSITYSRTADYASASSSTPITPELTEPYNGATANSSSSEVGKVRYTPNIGELTRLKFELEAAKGKIARMDQELAQTRITKHTLDQAIGSASEADLSFINIHGKDFHNFHPSHNGPPHSQHENSWGIKDDNRSDTSESLSASGFNHSRSIWGSMQKSTFNGSQTGAQPFQQQPSSTLDHTQYLGRNYIQPYLETSIAYSSTPINGFRGDRMLPETELIMNQTMNRRAPISGRFSNRSNGLTQYSSSNCSFDGFANSSAGGISGGSIALGTGLNPNMNSNLNLCSNYHPLPIGTPLSPHAPEFTSSSNWKGDVVATEGSTYLPTTEPLNYRRLLDRTVNCNWKYIVDKIVCNNDQQASIFLQQKLKVGTLEQKYDIVEAIVAQAYPLMVNRFGNFLVQRCFEHGTPAQVIKIAEAIRGQTLNLSMDAFGCHVVQKAFDSVPEDYKAVMVHELLRRIPETVIHRYACHVWQKLFELRWTESPPQIMKYVNDALQGMWHEVALGETGSLVVQNIFENCLELDKRPCIEEVLASIDIVAHGQFGNWCIQHICEHGVPADRSRAIDHVIRYASEYSMDQFASKVVEKCLKIGGSEFLSRYLDRVCEGRLDRPRIPLIEIASDQYGNYLIQYILTHSNPQHREIVAQHIRKHMVSLRGSKFGSRVGMLCTNPAIQTRPGPGVGPAIGAPSRTSLGPQQGPRYTGAYR